jgi:phosphoadenosine phosphosulfate reductase
LNARRPIISTNFRPLSIALVHLVTRVKADIPVVWVDSGYNTEATYRFVDRVTRQFKLNLHIYTPRGTAARRAQLEGRAPEVDTPEHARFTHEVKLEPFERALDDWRPDFWITGIRRDQSDYRRSLEVVSDGPRGVTRIAPIYRWTEVDVEGYIDANGLPDYDDYHDPTKGKENRECGLQTLA